MNQDQPRRDDSRSVVSVSKNVSAQIRQFGFSHVSSLLPPDEVRNVHSQLVELLQRLSLCDSGGDQFLSRERHSTSQLQQLILEARKSAEGLRSLHKLTRNDNLISLMREILNDEVFLHPRKFLRIGLPHVHNPLGTTAHHQDYRYVQGALDTLTVWIPFADYQVQNGILSVASKSHLRGLVPISHQPGSAFEYVIEGVEPGSDITSVRAGDCIIFHSLTIHGAHPNLSSRVRLSIDCRFQRIHDQIAEPAMLAPFVCDPSVISNEPRSWSQDPWYSYPTALQQCEATDFRSVQLRGNSSFISAEETYAV
jgi:hypothetical protein